MPSIFPMVPKNFSSLTEIADFIEFECLKAKDRNVAVEDIVSILSKPFSSFGDEQLRIKVEDAFSELEDRCKSCGQTTAGYPFSLNSRGNLLRYNGNAKNRGTLYLFLLFATRLNMRDERVQGEIDGALLFEGVSSETAVRYFGGPSTYIESIVFGTARFGDRKGDEELDQPNFVRTLNELCSTLGEGEEYQARRNTVLQAKDDKLDIVVWSKFSDRREGKLIGFGQCKTGTHWRQTLTSLQPVNFCNNWMRKSPPVMPVRLFFLSDRVQISNWSNRVQESGLLFDRCRIVDVCSRATRLPTNLIADLRTWLDAAAGTKGISLKLR